MTQVPSRDKIVAINLQQRELAEQAAQKRAAKPLHKVETTASDASAYTTALKAAKSRLDRYKATKDLEVWSDIQAADLLGLFSHFSEKLYGERPLRELADDPDKWDRALVAAQNTIQKFDAPNAAELVRWKFKDLTRRHQYNVCHHRVSKPLGVLLFFGKEIWKEFEHHQREEGLEDTPEDIPKSRPKTLAPARQARSQRKTVEKATNETPEPKWYEIQRAISKCTRDSNLPITHKCLLYGLATYINANWECWPSKETLAQEVGVKPRRIRRLLQDLETGKLSKTSPVTITRNVRMRESGRGRTSDIIRVTLHDRSDLEDL